ncbi:hypothetical protein J4P90_18920 [Bacillus sp. SY8(2021)]|uniref:Uncharacterized protein n=1 Tax=Bacillus arachidis TaxID=2819290 RepID=A0ABS3P261_9BACI|nr:hypothetical protein [Bacillus arachidis]
MAYVNWIVNDWFNMYSLLAEVDTKWALLCYYEKKITKNIIECLQFLFYVTEKERR